MGKGGDTLSKGEVLPDKPVETSEIAAGTKTQNGVSNSQSSSSSNSNSSIHWARRGGMHVFMVGAALNIFGPLFPLAFGASKAMVWTFCTILAVHILSAKFVFKMSSQFCVLVCPVYLSSLLFAFTLNDTSRPAVNILLLSVVLAIFKVAICMSTCLHRYSAHAAFKCGPITQLFVCSLGCLANQGGPIWWASQHRCHHKYCDVARDPHSAAVSGVEDAFSFFERLPAVEEEFAPKHLCEDNCWYLRILDTWACLFVTMEFMTVYWLFGREGLFLSYTSAWICQTITLWFNVAHHPEQVQGTCKAANFKAKPQGYYPAFLLFDFLHPLFGLFVGEQNHDDHHKHTRLAKRDATDCAYYLFIYPLEVLGLFWDVQVLPETPTTAQ